MKFRKIFFPAIVFILFISTTGCEEIPSGPQIEWLSSVTTTYSYSGGVRSGATIIVKFNVTDDQSGELTIDARIGSTEKSCSLFVEAGEQYRVAASCGIGKEGSSSKLTLDPSSESKTLEVSVTGYSVSLNGVNMY